MSREAEGTLAALEKALAHRFTRPDLLETALLHASLAHELGQGRGNERLEFLGDAVVDLVVAELLYETHPDWNEGELTRGRSGLVNREALAECGRSLALGSFIRLGRTEQQSGGQEKDTILADCFEAVVGALYLDAGLLPVERLIARLLGDAIAGGAARDPKTEIQEWAHAERRETPHYHTLGDSGGDDDDERFTVEVRIGEEILGRGVGRSKRLAERRAAQEALDRAVQDG